MKVLYSLLAIIGLHGIFVQAQNYCDTSLCSSGVRHIACGNTGAFTSRCPANARVVSMTSSKALILRMHNIRRNRLAGGTLSSYSPASRMMEITWDDELARIALLNAKQCVMTHDACRNTQRFQRSGQNIATSSTRGMANNLRNHLVKSIQGWWVEYRVANMNIINSFQSPKTVGHFTTMSSDRNTKVGCGTVRYTRNGRDTLLTTCNYAATNIFNRPVYKTGTAGSACTSGRSTTYPNLCSTSEPINPNST